MSLIADSLKSALRQKAGTADARPEINLLPRAPKTRFWGESFKLKKGGDSGTRIFFMIVLPSSILIYLIYVGAFDKRHTTFDKLPIWKTLGLVKQQKPFVAPMVTAQAPAAVKPLAAPPPEQPKTASAVQVPAAQPLDAAAPKTQVKSVKAVAGKKPKPLAPRATEELPSVGKPAIAEEAVAEIGEPAVEAETPPAKQAAKKAVKKAPSEKPAVKKAEKKTPRRKPKTAENAYPETKPDGAIEMAALPPSPKPAPSPVLPTPEIFKDANYYFNRALHDQQMGDMEKALLNYRQASEINPNNADIYNNMGVIYKDQGKYGEADEALMRAVFLDPNYVKAYNNLGVIRFLEKDYPGALANYQKALDLKPDNVETYNNIAVIYKALNERAKAKATLNKALSIDPNHPGTNYNLALLYEEEGALKPAIHFYRRFVQLGETSHAALAAEVREHLKTLE